MAKKSTFVILSLLMLALLLSDASACEGCKNFSATSTGQSVKMVQASFSWSVLFLLGMPLALLGWFVRVMVQACRAADSRSQLGKN